jgi:hypothetical protein
VSNSCWRPQEYCMDRLAPEQVVEAAKLAQKKYIDVQVTT